MRQVGRLIAFKDFAGEAFAFAICPRCHARLERLPMRVQQTQLSAAVGILARHPERYELRHFDSVEAAHLFVALEAERLRYELAGTN